MPGNPRSAFNPLHTDGSAHARETCRATHNPPDEAALTAAMTAVGLENRLSSETLSFEMSGGMLQPNDDRPRGAGVSPFIFADEPTTDLDAVAQGRILDLLEEIVSSRGQNLLLVTHDMGVVARLAHEVAVMDHGRIVERCDVNTLFSAPQHPVSQRLLAAHPALYGMEFGGINLLNVTGRQPRLPAPSGRAARRQPEISSR